MTLRPATSDDVTAIATLHAESWRRHYRGAFSDSYLDGDLLSDRLAVWTERLARPMPDLCTIVAGHDGVVVGFAHTRLDDDPRWGALLDNLHVAHGFAGQGIGTDLMAETAAAVVERTPTAGLYLWVLEPNLAAQAFYEARGGRCVGREVSEAPGGGSVVGLRYAWPDPSRLLPPGRRA
jgi:ribosomal protein S18 acetylase RimI-like enzyme